MGPATMEPSSSPLWAFLIKLALIRREGLKREARAHPTIHPPPAGLLSQSFRGGNLCHGRLSQSCNCPALFHVQCSAQSQTVRQLKREAFFTTQTFASTCAYHAHTLQAGSMLSWFLNPDGWFSTWQLTRVKNWMGRSRRKIDWCHVDQIKIEEVIIFNSVEITAYKSWILHHTTSTMQVGGVICSPIKGD